MDTEHNKLEYTKELWKGHSTSQEFQAVLLYIGGDESGRPLQQSPKLQKFNLKQQTLVDYHFDMLYKNGITDIVIVTYKEIAKDVMKHPLPKEMTQYLNIKICVLREIEDSTVNAMRLISSEISQGNLIIIHGQYILDMNLKDAIAVHKIHDSDMTLVLKKQGELEEKIDSGSALEQYNLYGLSQPTKLGTPNLEVLKQSYGVYAMFNNFEASDPAGLSVHKSVLRKCPSLILRSDLNDTGVYIMRNIFTSKALKVETINFDLVKLMVNNQFKKKLQQIIGSKPEDDDTKEIDDLLIEELGSPDRAIIMAWVKDNETDIAIDMNILNNQNDSEDEGMGLEEPDSASKGEMLMSDSD